MAHFGQTGGSFGSRAVVVDMWYRMEFSKRRAASKFARVRIAELEQTVPESAPDVQMMLSFLGQTSPQRGIVR